MVGCFNYFLLPNLSFHFLVAKSGAKTTLDRNSSGPVGFSAMQKDGNWSEAEFPSAIAENPVNRWA
jgi:hypothetical protein